MPWTKQQFIDAAFAEFGLAGYIFDLTPDQQQLAVNKLDAMMASWNALGIRLGYPISASPNSAELSTQTNVPDSANEAIYTNLAIRLAPAHGKTVSTETRMAAGMGWRAMINRSVNPLPVQMPAWMPAGQGHRWTLEDRVFLDAPSERVDAGPDAQIDNFEVE